MRSPVFFCLPLCCLLMGSPGLALGQKALPPRLGIVFVANGSNDDISVSENLGEIIRCRSLPLSMTTIRWCRWAQMAKDHKDFEAQIQAAGRLAAMVAAYRQAHPNEKIYLIGHSAGNHVILAATDLLPPRTVDRLVLLAPSVSYCYDLRQALRCAREGIDSYWSTEDQLVALGSDLFKTADGLAVKPAGEVGFARLPSWHPEARLYDNLRQDRWNWTWAWTGHNGGHYGFTCAGFLDACVVPTMLAAH